MIEQEWLYGFFGGTLIGLAAAIFLLVNGRIMGASGIIGGLVDKSGWHNFFERTVFIVGLILIPAIASFTYNSTKTNITSNIYLIIIAGLLVGIGTSLAQGCTSGHGVCGISRISFRSIVATVFYIISGVTIVFTLRNYLEIL